MSISIETGALKGSSKISKALLDSFARGKKVGVCEYIDINNPKNRLARRIATKLKRKGV